VSVRDPVLSQPFAMRRRIRTTGLISEWRVRIGPQRRLVLPALICRATGLKPGDVVTASVQDGDVVLSTRRTAIRKLQKMLRGVGKSMTRELIEERREEAGLEFESR
jgi:bifunctional DNA-binding transcriptional regulator/antitoxin component of YhaV-PrlF toxin-antitoxin module